MGKVCLSTFVYGEKYQDYIPFLLFSITKSYPEYYVTLFVYNSLSIRVQKQIADLSLDDTKIKIIENVFSNGGRMTPQKSQCLRWLLWDDSFYGFDYIYFVDIDILYFREPKPIHIQHAIHMEKTGLPYDNMRRLHIRHPFAVSDLMQRLKYANVKKLLRFFFGEKVEYRATGLHFIRVKDYYSAFDSSKRQLFTNWVFNGAWLKEVMYPNDEVLLYKLLEIVGLHPEKLPIQTNSSISLDFDNCEREEFRPHHGIHLGIFRMSMEQIIGSSANDILSSTSYNYYVEQLVNGYLKDKRFQSLLNSASSGIKDLYRKLFVYYKIDSSNILFDNE